MFFCLAANHTHTKGHNPDEAASSVTSAICKGSVSSKATAAQTHWMQPFVKSRSKWGSILDHDGQIQVFGSVLDRRLHIWTVTHVSIKVTPLPPQYMNISWNVFSAMKMIFHHNLSKEPKFALLRTIPAGSEGSAQTLATYQETRPISTILYKTPNFCLARGMQNTVIIQRSGPRQWQSQQYRQIWSKCWGEILIRSPSC